MADELARLLRMTRAQQGLTLRTAEEVTGVTKETISELERGLRVAQMPTLARLAEGYNLDLETVLITAGLLPVEEERPHPKDEAPTSPPPVVEDLVDEERRAFYQSVAGAVELFCDEWEDRLDRGDHTPDTLDKFWQQSLGMVTTLNPAWETEWTYLRRERGDAATLLDTILYPTMQRFAALQDRYQRLMDEVSVPDEVTAMREKLRKAG